MAPPFEIRDETLKQLRQTILKMTSTEWKLALKGKPTDVGKRAAKELLRVQRARLRLENAELADIRDQLQQNEKALEEGGKRVAHALRDLRRVESVLRAVSSFLSVVGKVVALA